MRWLHFAFLYFLDGNEHIQILVDGEGNLRNSASPNSLSKKVLVLYLVSLTKIGLQSVSYLILFVVLNVK